MNDNIREAALKYAVEFCGRSNSGVERLRYSKNDVISVAKRFENYLNGNKND